ncbi:hypothetical protein WJX75_009356 [Coccomyxa subellipsoidea]|uniref:Ubiquitin-like protease family profile domain-containing protein n=1 Tax=Coccomyxa subellipsoidea TaxID=248742 RepID=A0ABR2YK05_9CHLO
MDSMRSTENTLTAEELRRKYLDLTTPTLSEKIRSLEVSYLSVAGRTKDGGDNFLRRISQMKAEYERRTEGKPWLKQAIENQADFEASATEQALNSGATGKCAAVEDTRVLNTTTATALLPNGVKATDDSNTRPVAGRARRLPHLYAVPSQGLKQIEAAQNGVPKRRQTGAAGKPAAASKPAAPPAVSRPGNLKGHLLLTRSMQGEPQQQAGERGVGGQKCFNCEQHRSTGITLKDMGFMCSQCHDAQGAAENGAGKSTQMTRAATNFESDFDDFDFPHDDTRRIQQPRLKDTGLNTKSFYGKVGTSAPARPRAKGADQEGAKQTIYSQTRQPLPRKRKVEQDNEPITLDDTDDEEAGPGPGSRADAAQPRRSQRSNAFKGPTQRFQGLKALFPACGGPGAVEITPADLARLDPEEFLNDTIIDFFMRYIWEQLSDDVKDRCYFFNSFFWKKLTEKSTGANNLDNGPRGSVAAANHERVKKWTKGLDIFKKDFLFVPIHDHLHWSLLIVCNPGADPDDPTRTPCMLHLDSMTGGHSTPGLKKAVCNFLTQEWDRKASEGGESVAAKWVAANPDAPLRSFELLAKKVKLPMQDNYCDCGLFLLTYVDFFTYSLPKALRLTIQLRRGLDVDELTGLSDYPLFLHQKWFFPGNASKLRRHIRNLLLELFVEQLSEGQRESCSDAIAEAYQDITAYEEATERYQGPADYLPQGLLRMEQHKKEQDRQAQEKQRKVAEAKERSEQRRGLSQPGSQPSVGAAAADNDPESRRHKAADAAERRRRGMSSSAELEDNLEIDLAESPRDSSESPAAQPFEQFRLHSKSRDGPLGKQTATLDRTQGDICKQDVEWRSKGSKGSGFTVKKRRLVEYSSDEDEGEAVRCIKEADELGDRQGGSATPVPEKALGRLETPMLEQRYSAHFRLHKRFSSEGDRVAHVEVEVLQPARNGTILQEPSKRERFASEASAYEWMDCKLRLNPINSTPPLARKPTSIVGCAPTDYGIPDWSTQPISPAVRSPSILVGTPMGRVSDRTRNAPSRSDKQQGEASSKAAREDGAYGAEFKRQEVGAAAHEAHDLTADEDKADEAGQPIAIAEMRPHAYDAAAAATQRARDATASLHRMLVMGPSGDDSEPAAATNSQGYPPWLRSEPAAASKLSWNFALAKASKLSLPDETQQKQRSAAHQDGFTTSEEGDAAGAAADEDEPTSNAHIDLTAESGVPEAAAAANSPALQQVPGSYQEAAAAQPSAALADWEASEQLPADTGSPSANGAVHARTAALDRDERHKLRMIEKRRRYKHNKKARKLEGSQNPLSSIQEQQNASSSDEGEEELDACSPSARCIDPVLAVDLEADTDSPVADSPVADSPVAHALPMQSLSAREEADRQLALKLQAQEQELSFASHLSDMHLDEETEARKDEDYVPGKEGGKSGKRKGKGSPRPSPKKRKPPRIAAADACMAAAVARMGTPPSGGRRQRPMSDFLLPLTPLHADP